MSDRNEQLADLIGQAGLSNAGLARRVVDLAAEQGIARRYTHIDVSRWIGGTQPRGAVPSLIARVLAAKLGGPVSVADIGMASTTDGAFLRAREYHEDYAETVQSIRAVAHMEGGGHLTAGDSVDRAAWGEVMIRWLLNSDQPAICWDETTDEHAMTLCLAVEFFRQLDAKLGGGYARSTLIEFIRSEVCPILDNPAGVSRATLTPAARLLMVAGWTAYDAGAHAVATRYFTQALRLAQEAGAPSLGGRILAAMSHQAHFLGYDRDALNLARAAQRGAQAAAGPTGQAVFYAMEGRALAALGDRAGVDAARQKAEVCFELRAPENDDAWFSYFGRSEFGAEWAHCYRDLGDYPMASHFGQMAMMHADPSSPRNGLFAQFVVASAHVGAGDLDAGLSVARVAAQTSRAVQSYRARSYLADFVTRLDAAQYQGHSDVLRFKEEARAA